MSAGPSTRGGVCAALIAGLVAAACGAGADDESDETIDIFGPYRGADADRWIEVIHAYTEPRGIDVRYIGSEDFVNDLQQRLGQGNDPPDLAVVPQPGFVEELAATEAIQPLGEGAIGGLDRNYPPAVDELVRIDDIAYGVPFRLTVKSLVWYRPEVFEANGWTPPATMAELADLVQRIEDTADDDGHDLVPWCLGLESGTSTGWPATDWVEDLVVRNLGTIVYEAWASGDVGFSDPRIAMSFRDFRQLVLAEGRVVGGLTGVVETGIDDAVQPLFDDDGCVLYKQADFAVQWMPDGTEVGPDGDVNWFVLPPLTDTQEAPIVVGADQVVQFTSTPRIEGLMTYLAGPDAGRSWAEAGGFLSPKSTIDGEDYGDAMDQRLTALLDADPRLVFDASDQMPVEVGSDLLWSEITDWVSGATPYQTFAETIDLAYAEATGRLTTSIGSLDVDR